jgi:hypothetical protein
MSYQILQDDFYIQNITLPGGIPGVQRYGLRYDSTTGDYVVSQKSAAGYTITIAAATLIQNGSFTSDAVRDSLLFTNNDVNQPTQKAKDLLLDVNRKVNAAYQKLGGSNKGNKINPAALPANQGRFVVNNAAADTSAGIASAIAPFLAAPPGQGNIFDDINLDDYGTKNMPDLFKDEGGLLKYPVDIIENRQDILKITQYEYKSPYGDVFKGNQNGTIFTNGAQRQSALKSLIATIILPIPNNISDSNGVNWGDGDQMNSTAMGAAGSMDKVIATVVAGKTFEALSKLTGRGEELGKILGGSTALNAAVMLEIGALNNPTTKAALFSKILKAADFDISPETILSRGYGVVANSNLELLFSGPMLRGFQFGYILSPRSEKEAIMCRKIIRFFKQGMAAKKSNKTGGYGASSFLLATPNVFKLEYKTFGKDGEQKDIAGLNKFKICALTNIQTSYADGQWSAFEEGQPVRYQINLSFKELEPIYESDYQDTRSTTFIKNENGYKDQPPVGKDEIGF